MQKLLSPFQQSSITFKAHFIISFISLLLVMYLSTGTLSPYANTVDFPPDYPLVKSNCRYLFNGDYYQHAALYYLIKGKPKESWEYTMHLRRILYNLLAYPFMRLFEHDLGGIITNFIITIFAFLSFALFTLKTSGEAGAIAGLWLLALFPGIAYFVGQPFLYSLIVPICLWTYMLFWKLDRVIAGADPCLRRNVSEITLMGKIFVISLCIGLFFIAYDFIVFLLPAMLFLLIYRKKYEVLPVAITGMLLVTAIWWCFVHFVLRTSFESQNTVFYADVAQSYCSPIDFTRWMESLKKLPSLIMANFIFSCFLFLPILFLFFLILGYSKRLRLHAFEACLFISIALVFLFINCAPPYDKPWDMHGDWIARLYEPMFVVMLFYCVRFIQSLKNSQQTRFRKWLFTCALVSATAGNGIVSFGPALNDPAGISSTIYWKFYKHAPKETMKKNLAKYGRRPWGFCQ